MVYRKDRATSAAGPAVSRVYRRERMSMRRLLVLILIFLSVTCMAGEPSMKDSKTYCVGRYIVDVPENAELYAQLGEYIFGPVQTNTRYANLSAFQKRMQEREAGLKRLKGKAILFWIVQLICKVMERFFLNLRSSMVER